MTVNNATSHDFKPTHLSMLVNVVVFFFFLLGAHKALEMLNTTTVLTKESYLLGIVYWWNCLFNTNILVLGKGLDGKSRLHSCFSVELIILNRSKLQSTVRSSLHVWPECNIHMRTTCSRAVSDIIWQAFYLCYKFSPDRPERVREDTVWMLRESFGLVQSIWHIGLRWECNW